MIPSRRIQILIGTPSIPIIPLNFGARDNPSFAILSKNHCLESKYMPKKTSSLIDFTLKQQVTQENGQPEDQAGIASCQGKTLRGYCLWVQYLFVRGVSQKIAHVSLNKTTKKSCEQERKRWKTTQNVPNWWQSVKEIDVFSGFFHKFSLHILPESNTEPENHPKIEKQ